MEMFHLHNRCTGNLVTLFPISVSITWEVTIEEYARVIISDVLFLVFFAP